MSSKYYVINYSETGIGRIFWYSCGLAPESLRHDHGLTSEEWEYFKVFVEEYDEYRDVCDLYPFMPRTFFPPSHIHIRWLGL